MSAQRAKDELVWYYFIILIKQQQQKKEFFWTFSFVIPMDRPISPPPLVIKRSGACPEKR